MSKINDALVWLSVTPECHQDYVLPTNETSCISTRDSKHTYHFCILNIKLNTDYLNYKGYLFGSISIVLIWFLSLVACIIVGTFKKYKDFLILTLRALAIGTLLGDSLMHLIPSVSLI